MRAAPAAMPREILGAPGGPAWLPLLSCVPCPASSSQCQHCLSQGLGRGAVPWHCLWGDGGDPGAMQELWKGCRSGFSQTPCSWGRWEAFSRFTALEHLQRQSLAWLQWLTVPVSGHKTFSLPGCHIHGICGIPNLLCCPSCLQSWV